MFEFTSKEKLFSMVLMAVGIIALVIGFTSAPSSVEDIAHHADGHAYVGDMQFTEGLGGGDGHAEHMLHQMQNRPWAALFHNAFFFLAIGLGALFFLAIQYVANVGWSVVLNRIMEAMGLWLVFPAIVIILVMIAGGMHMHHLWHWMEPGIMDKGSDNYDAIIAGKQAYLNFGFFVFRSLVYVAGWVWAIKLIRKNSLLEDNAADLSIYKKQIRIGAIFTVFFAVTSSMAAWDWIMSIDTHWFSTLFGWYTFAGIFVSALASMALITVYLKSKGYLEEVNENHLHDLGKFTFAFSIFWTYLWFSQYMLIWYSNIPEEVTYYMQRFDEYKAATITAIVLNFLVPFLLILPRESKRNMGLVAMAAIIVLVGHWIDSFVMIMPGTVGPHFGLGWAEVGGFFFFLGFAIYVIFTNLSKAPLIQKNHPVLQESKYFHQ
ncbi:MAG: quinol:cytochrome C oxidoreductase [Schleiferiaceae bacterium]|nr:quinol:cytochrome C oxidoreductase [Schleiferiaceae bacterium]